MAIRLQLRRDTAANWTSVNPILALGEPGVETDTLKVKVGDGVTAWNSLDYSISNDFDDLLNTPTTLAGYGIVDALALANLSVTDTGGDGSLSYNNSTGVFTYTGPSASEVRAHFSAGTGITITSGEIATTITQYADSDVDAHLSGGTGVTYTAGAISIGQAVGTGDSVEFAKVTTSTIDSADSSPITVETDVVMLSGLTVGNHIVPSSNENFDLGSPTNRFRTLYLAGETIDLAGVTIKKVGNAIELPTGTVIGNKAVAATDQPLNTTDDTTFNSVTADIFTSLIDSADSSAITITPDVVMSAGLTVGNHILPSSNENVDLGSATNRFRDLYLSGNSAIIGDLALKRHTSGGLIVADHSTGNPTNITTHNIVANDITAAGDVNITGNTTLTGYLAGPETFVIDPAAVGDNTGTVVIAGNLQVDGTTTTINSTTVEIDDKNLVLSSGSPNAVGSDGAGITIDNGSDTDATMIYDGVNDEWDFNKTITAPAGNITTVNATTVDSTNVEVTNIKAKDGTASATIADSTGVMTVASSVLTTADINGGTIDGTTIGGTSAAAGTFTTLNTSGSVVFNEVGADADFRVESEVNANTIFVDGERGQIKFGGGSLTNSFLSLQGTPTTTTASQYALRNDVTHDASTNSTIYGVANTHRIGATGGVTAGFGFHDATLATQGGTMTSYASFFASPQTVATTNYGFRSQIASGSNRWNFYADGTAPNYFAGGVNLGGTTSANLLDDYEEGTWTPTIVRHTGTNPSYTASTANGFYTKIGNVVTIQMLIIITGVSTQGSGNIMVSGLPFAGVGDTYSQVLNVGYNDTFDEAIKDCYVTGSSLQMIPTGITQSNYGGVLSTGYLSISGSYRTT